MAVLTDNLSSIREQLEDKWLPAIYSQRVRPERTRSFSMNIPEKENAPDILFTLLGIELKVGKRRIACPDLSTARYLRVFARIGCGSVAVPYDITKIPVIADELETSWQTTLLLIERSAAEMNSRQSSRFRSFVIKEIRKEIENVGAGSIMPSFKTSTSQRGR